MAYTVEDLLAVALPIAMERLVEAADRRETASYADVARYIAKRAEPRFARCWHHVGHVAGSLMDRISEVAPSAPPINTLVVKAAGLPGNGADFYIERYLHQGYRKLSAKNKRVLIERLHESVWSFNDWRAIGRKVFGAAFVSPPPIEGESDGKARRLGWGGPPESEEHQRLKEYVAKHPRKFGAPKECKEGVVECRLQSADEIDVWFMSVGEQLAVEVKSRRSKMRDVERGIFQCVKYRSLLEAQSQVARFSTKQNIRSLLVSEQPLSPKLKRWANKLAVEVQVIKPLKSRPRPLCKPTIRIHKVT